MRLVSRQDSSEEIRGFFCTRHKSPTRFKHIDKQLTMKRLTRARAAAAVMAAAIGSLFLMSCAQPGSAFKKDAGFVFGTTYSLTYRCDSDLQQRVLNRLAQYDSSLSVYNPSSLLSKLNEGDSIVADSMLLHVIREAKRFHAFSRGAFDITVEPLSRHWRFTRDLEDDTISVEQWDALVAGLDTVRPLVGLDKIEIDGNVIRKADRKMKLNANALAEGFGIDVAASVFEELGLKDYMVELGGEIRCKGLNPRGQRWRIGIDRPEEGGIAGRRNQHIIEVTDCGVSTSGSYRQCYHVADGRTVQHTIDPRTGMPVSHKMRSVTVVGPNTMTTDALCTSLMVAGPDSALAMVDGLDGVEAYLIYDDEKGEMQEAMTDGFKALIADK